MTDTCAICQAHVDVWACDDYGYIDKGIEFYNRYNLCKNCFNKTFKKEKLKYKEYLWGDSEVKTLTKCDCCKKDVYEHEVHTIWKRNQKNIMIIYNFCDECCTNRFYKYVSLICLSKGEVVEHGF